jgi:hypothetical protein
MNMRPRLPARKSMRPFLLACLGLWLTIMVAGATTATADELDDFNAAVERASSHHRVALGYLRTGNVDLAMLELERMGDAWGQVTDRFGKAPPPPFRNNPLFGQAMLDVPTRLATASILVNIGRIDVARQGLAEIRTVLAKMRRASGVEVLADCILDANRAMDEFMAYRDQRPDWSKAGVGDDVARKGAAYGEKLYHCETLATSSTRADPEFRRLVDGAQASIAQVPKAVATRDSDLLHRLLIELRSFDNLLAFRFG